MSLLAGIFRIAATSTPDGHGAACPREREPALGTGGTLAGVSLALKEHTPAIRIVLADPESSGLRLGEFDDLTVQASSVTEGIGQSRVPAALESVVVDDALRIPASRSSATW